MLLAEDGEVASERFARLALGLQLFPQGVLGGGKFGAFGGECVFCLLLAHFCDGVGGYDGRAAAGGLARIAAEQRGEIVVGIHAMSPVWWRKGRFLR